MTEWKLFHGDVAVVSTYDFHKDRERARHLEQPGHRERLLKAADFIRAAAKLIDLNVSVSDLGCGDGGLLSVICRYVPDVWGYDFGPANVAGWAERGINAELLDVFGEDSERVRFGAITAVTEVLEHLTDPHGAIQWIGKNSRFVVASSPWDEGPWGFDECHAWAWDMQGYRDLISDGGYRILRHEQVGRFQVVLGMRA